MVKKLPRELLYEICKSIQIEKSVYLPPTNRLFECYLANRRYNGRKLINSRYFPVHKIISKRIIESEGSRETEFLVWFANYSKEEAEWTSESNLFCEKIKKEFLKKNKNKPIPVYIGDNLNSTFYYTTMDDDSDVECFDKKQKKIKKKTNFRCNVCNKSYVSAYNLQRHQRDTCAKEILCLGEIAPSRTDLTKRFRFHSSAFSDVEKKTTLGEYIERMQEKQQVIYYMVGTSSLEAESPFLKKGYEVLYLTEAVDEYAIQSMSEFEGKKFQNVAKEELKLNEEAKSEGAPKDLEKKFEPLTNSFKEKRLTDNIEKLVVSQRLTQSPSTLAASAYGWSDNMERIMKSQPIMKSCTKLRDLSTGIFAKMKKTFEINPRNLLAEGNEENQHRLNIGDSDGLQVIQSKRHAAYAGNQPAPSASAAGNVVIRDYDPMKARATTVNKAISEFIISPLTNKHIPADKLQEHVRYNTIDTQYKEHREREQMERQDEDPSNTSGTEISRNIAKHPERRTDIFGIGEKAPEQTIIAKKFGEEERQLRRDQKTIWYGQHSTIDATTRTVHHPVIIEQQISKLHKQHGFVSDTSMDCIGPKGTAVVPSSPPPVLSPQTLPPPPMSSTAALSNITNILSMNSSAPINLPILRSFRLQAIAAAQSPFGGSMGGLIPQPPPYDDSGPPNKRFRSEDSLEPEGPVQSPPQCPQQGGAQPTKK